jgi:carbon storage regulator CsrA
MLVLSRKDGQQIVIGDDVVVSILRIAGNRVRIGIKAPESVRIVRGELDLFADESQYESTSDLEIVNFHHEPVS